MYKWSPWLFVIASIGAAAGLGNLWRFPYLAYENGGAAFIIAIIVTNLLIGIPLFIAESSAGQMTESGAHKSMGLLNRKFGKFGFLLPVTSFAILTYYTVIMAWGVKYLFSSFSVSWGSDTNSFFFEDTLNISSGVGEVGGLTLALILPLILVWAATYLSARDSVRSISKVVVWTATIPFVTLLILMIRAVTLEGAWKGISLYLIPDWSALLEFGVWSAAIGQTFFSLGIAFGITYVYGAFNNKNYNIVKGSILVAVGNFLVSFLSGFVVFGILGYMATIQGVSVTEVVSQGVALAFITIPLAISLIPKFAAVFAILFFVSILLLALDSAFALLEVASSAVKDAFNLNIRKATKYLTIIGFILSLVFITGGGLYYLDIVDHFLSQYILTGIAFIEIILFGWILSRKSEMSIANFVAGVSNEKIASLWKFLIKYFSPIVILYLFINQARLDILNPYGDYPTWALWTFGFGIIVFVIIVSAILYSRFKKEQ